MSHENTAAFSGMTFPEFVDLLWPAIGSDTKAPLGWAEHEICQWVDERHHRRRGVLAPRGMGKTYLVVCAYATYRLAQNPDEKILIISKSEGHAKKIIFLIRQWIGSVPWLRWLAPQPESRERMWRDNVLQFDVGPSTATKDASVTACGIDGQLEGGRASIVMPDDVETGINTRTVEARELLAQRAHEFLNVCTYGDREQVWVGTFWHEESLYLDQAKKGVEFRTWPMLTPGPGDNILNLAPGVQQRIDNGDLKPGSGQATFDGERVFPHKHDEQYVAEQKATGRVNFAMQHMLIADMGDSSLYPLRLSDLIVLDCRRDDAPTGIRWAKHDHNGSTRIEDIDLYGFTGDYLHRPVIIDDTWAPYGRSLMWVDPALGKVGRDRIGYAVVAQARGYLYLKAAGGLTGQSRDTQMRTLVEIALKHGVREIHVEDFALQSDFAFILEPYVARERLEPGQSDIYPQGWSASVEATKPRMAQSQKELRIIGALDPVMTQHRLVVDPNVIRSEDLQYQMTRITRQRGSLRHDDIIDAVANAVALLAEDMRIDPEKAEQRHRDKLLDQELEKFYNGTAGNPRVFGSIARPTPHRSFTHH